MRKTIEEVFYKKMPLSINDILPRDYPQLITFLNPYSVQINKNNVELYDRFDYIGSDGILPVLILKFIKFQNFPRISFDMSSFAPIIFNYCIRNKLSIYFIGSRQKDIEIFKNIVLSEYSELIIAGVSNGYIDDEVTKIAEIKEASPDIIVIGMGSPKQDVFAIKLKDAGFGGTIYTCGGFFHQTTKQINYYPQWVNKLNLRAFYRAYCEPHVLKRLLLFYPVFICKFSLFCLRSTRR